MNRRFIITAALFAVAIGVTAGIMGANWLISRSKREFVAKADAVAPVSANNEIIIAGKICQVKYAFGALGWVTLIKLADLNDASKYYFVATEGWNNDFVISALMEVAFLNNEDLALSEEIEEWLREDGRVERKTSQMRWKKMVDYKKYRPID